MTILHDISARRAAHLAAQPQQRFPLTGTARATIEARIGRPLGPTRDMPPDLRRALAGLARQYARQRRRHPATSIGE